MKHYTEVVDQLFGTGFAHRSLRTLFDPGSSEWHATSMEQKLAILRKIVASDEIPFDLLLVQYKLYYATELNKPHVVKALEAGLTALLLNALDDDD